ncbi:MAG: gene transfer agent family protein [Pseudomonadota bacterium]
MVNPVRGETVLHANGQSYPMKLTLGALAVLEGELGTGGLIGLAERFETGGFGGQDLIALLAAGLRGGGAEIDTDAVAAFDFDGGVIGAAEAASDLLALTFRGVGT